MLRQRLAHALAAPDVPVHRNLKLFSSYRLTILVSLTVCVTLDLIHDLSGHLLRSALDAASRKCF